MSTQRGQLVVVTGPSGAGKDSVINTAKELGLEFGQVVTTSTRPKRLDEQAGDPYYFVTVEQFKASLAADELIEWAEVYGNYYGCTKAEIERKLADHAVVIVKVDPQGARAYKALYPDTTTIFIMPPSYEYLEKRLVNRETDSKEVIKQRLATAQKELENLLDWDYLVVNEEGKLKEAAEEVIQIINKNKDKV
ncbi:MAG: guanylate kinase [Candidatus Kerfeldbacteria bacterium]|nr:guanylate kinase [Candidatus Kerfeldbacteria bacterium]